MLKKSCNYNIRLHWPLGGVNAPAWPYFVIIILFTYLCDYCTQLDVFSLTCLLYVLLLVAWVE